MRALSIAAVGLILLLSTPLCAQSTLTFARVMEDAAKVSFERGAKSFIVSHIAVKLHRCHKASEKEPAGVGNQV